MTVSSSMWRPVVALGVGVALGWLARGRGGHSQAVLQLNETADALVVNGKAWSFAEMPSELRTRVHSAFLQANGQLRVALEDFAARVSRSGGQVRQFDWEQEAKPRIDAKYLRNLYDTALGFKNQGPFESQQVQSALMKFAIDRERSILINDELNKLLKENKLQFLWKLPLGAKLEEDLSVYPVIEVGPEGKPVAGELQVMFNYAQPFSESAFQLLSRMASDAGQRLRIRLLSEYTGISKEKAAIETISCVSSEKFNSNEILAVHIRLLQELPNLKSDTGTVDWKKAFAGNAELPARIEKCAKKSFAEDIYLKNTKQWSLLRQNPLPILFHDARRISEYDPRGLEEVVRVALAPQSTRK